MVDYILNIPFPFDIKIDLLPPKVHTFGQLVLGAPPEVDVEFTLIEPLSDIPGYSIMNLQDFYLTPTPQFIIPLFLNTPSVFFSEFDNYHQVTAYDQFRLDLIAYRYYLSTDYWWIIATANNLFDPFNLVIGSILRIPSDATASNEWLQKPVKKLRASDVAFFGSA